MICIFCGIETFHCIDELGREHWCCIDAECEELEAAASWENYDYAEDHQEEAELAET